MLPEVMDCLGQGCNIYARHPLHLRLIQKMYILLTHSRAKVDKPSIAPGLGSDFCTILELGEIRKGQEWLAYRDP